MYASKAYIIVDRLRVAKTYKKPKGGRKKNAALENHVALTIIIQQSIPATAIVLKQPPP